MRQGFVAILAAGMLIGPTVVAADPIALDLTVFEDGYNANPIEAEADGVTVTLRNTEGEEGDTSDDALNVWIGLESVGDANGFCFGDIYSCAFSGEMVFSQAVQDLMFYIVGWNTVGDAITIGIYNGATLLGSLDVTGDGLIDLAAYGAITRLFFEDSSIVDDVDGNGVAYARFTFNLAATEVPEPGTLALLGLGLAGLGLSRRRRRA